MQRRGPLENDTCHLSEILFWLPSQRSGLKRSGFSNKSGLSCTIRFAIETVAYSFVNSS